MPIFYLPSKETIINSDHIIRAEYTPEHVYRDTDEEGPNAPERTARARLILVLTELVQEEAISCGNTVGVSSISKKLSFHGVDAETLWDIITRHSYWLPVNQTSPQDPPPLRDVPPGG